MYGRAILFRGHSYLDSYIERSDKVRQLYVHRASSTRRQDSAEDHRSSPQGVLRARRDPAEGTERFPTKPFYHRYDNCDSWVIGVDAE